MNNEKFIVANYDEMKKAFSEWHAEMEAQKASSLSQEKTYSINRVAKILGRSHDKIKGLIKDGILETTLDERRIFEYSLNNYLKKQPQKKLKNNE